MRAIFTLCSVLLSTFVFAQIDSLVLQPGPTDGKDVMAWNIFPNNNYGTSVEATITAGTNGGNASYKRFYVQFDLSSLPAGTIIDSAFFFYFNNPTAPSHSGMHQSPNPFVIRRVTSAWTETGVTWNNQPNTTTVGQITHPGTTSSSQDLRINVTPLIQTLVDSTNHGFLVRLATESPFRAVVCGSSDHAIPAKRPMLKVYYNGCFLPVAQFVSSITQGTVQFGNASTAKPSAQYWWSFGDGTFSTMLHPSKTYANTGTYTVCLAVTDSCGTDTICETISVCTEALSQFSYAQNGAVIQFTPLNTWATTYLWDFGDGTFSTQQNPVKAFTISGQHMVCVTVTDSCGPGTTCESLTICLPPQPAYTHTPTGLTVQFTAANQNAISYKWAFGDGNISFTKNPLYTYPNSGTYTACVTVVDSCGEYTSCQNITVSGIGINEDRLNQFELYPNPATSQIKVQGDISSIERIAIYNSLGKAERISTDVFDKVDVSALAAGFYFVKIETSDGSMYQYKLVKQ